MPKLTEGTYVAVARSFDFGVTDNDNNFIKVGFEIIEGEYKGQFISWFGYFTKETAKRTVESLRYCGWSGDKISEEMPGMGTQKVRIVVGEDEYDGKKRLRVNWVNKIGAPKPLRNRLDTSGLGALNAGLSDIIMTTPTEDGVKFEGKPAYRVGNEPEDVGADADIPF